MMNAYRDAVENALANNPFLHQEQEAPITQPDCASPDEGTIPQPLRSSMRYSLVLPSKRLRPIMLLAAYHMVKEDWESALPFACALEMIHTYSLIHDDLPAMDNDALRRGKPTNHLVYGEDMAILAGDGLLNFAYETMLCAPISDADPKNALRATREMAMRAGVRGMIAGQTLDVKLEGHEPTPQSVRYIHLHKTADLFTAPLVAGLMLAGASDEMIEAGRVYGQNVGCAFQIVDDLLDLEGDAVTLGKETGMDVQRGKMTWPTVFGTEKSREDAKEAIDHAVNALSCFGEKADFLSNLAKQTLVRTM
ncbi:MAG: polyprenyl synthetase family protein [Clostridiales bacterium]|nr:polyprenyl synthetase family protein [Clostridiales bacterium]